MILSRQLGFAYPGEATLTFPDIHCHAQEHLLILGPSGAGKTTLLHLLGCILKPTQGQIIIHDQDVNSLSGKQLDHFRGKHIGIIFQRPHFIKSLTAIENVLFTQHLANHKTDEKLALSLLDHLQIRKQANKYTDTLSLGELQRLAIARACAVSPNILLADEPSSSLDDDNCYRMIRLLKQIAEERKANLIVVTHDERIKNEFSNQLHLLEPQKQNV